MSSDIADFQLPIADLKGAAFSEIGNRQLAIGNQSNREY
jgi:hypothetical protein